LWGIILSMNFVEGHEKLTEVFGRWPSFHDAEVLSFGFERVTTGFSVVTTIFVFESSNELTAEGHFRRIRETRATFRFHDCEDVTCAEFNHQNVISGLEITRDEVSNPRHPILVVFRPIYGLHGTLRCCRIELVSAIPA